MLLALAFFVCLAGTAYSVRKASRAETNAVRVAGRQAFRQIERSRINATRTSCHQRNVDRRTQRRIINRQIRQTKPLPDSVLGQFGITKKEALRNLRADKRSVHRIDCAAAVEQIKRTSPVIPAGRTGLD